MATAIERFSEFYDVDRAHSSVDIAIRHMQVSTFRVSFAYVDGRLTVEDGRSHSRDMRLPSRSRSWSRLSSASTSSEAGTSSTPTRIP